MSFTRLISRKLIEMATEYVTETIPSFIATAINGKLNKGTNTDTDTTTTSGIVDPSLQYLIQKFQPGGAITDAIRITGIRRYEYNSSQSNSGYGHHVPGLDWYVHTGSGNPGLAIAHEAKFDNESASATITSGVGAESQLSKNEGTITSFYGHRSRITENAGTVTTFTGYHPNVENNTGTLTTVIGYEFPDLSGLISTKRYFGINRDPNAPFLSAAPIIDQSITYNSPSATAFTYTVPDDKQTVLLTPVDGYASGTINLPAKSGVRDGQIVEITTSQAITAVTWGLNGSAFILNAPSGLAAGQTVKFRYYFAIDWWILANGDAPPTLPPPLIAQNSKSAAYTLILDDAGKHILHPAADTTARTFTIPANSSVPYPIGTVITFVNQNGTGGVVTIAISADTMRLAGAGTTGSRTLARNGIATAMKITATEWIINGTGLT